MSEEEEEEEEESDDPEDEDFTTVGKAKGQQQLGRRQRSVGLDVPLPGLISPSGHLAYSLQQLTYSILGLCRRSLTRRTRMG